MSKLPTVKTEVSYIRPVPQTWFAWYAGYDDWELEGEWRHPYGYGATEQEAIENLRYDAYELGWLDENYNWIEE